MTRHLPTAHSVGAPDTAVHASIGAGTTLDNARRLVTAIQTNAAQ
jgi:hypothetical protein